MPTPHRQHTLTIAASPLGDDRTWGESLKFWGVLIAAVLAFFAASIGGAYWLNGGSANVQIVSQPQVVTTPLPPPSDVRARALHERLADWRAGYEAAVQNGCKVAPILNYPVGPRP